MDHINKIKYLSNYNNGKYYIFEGLLLEHPNQAKKFLKQKNIDDAKAENILDKIVKITNRDGYTGLLTKFHVNSKIPIEDLDQVYNFLKQNKQLIKELPKPIFDYDNYRDFKNDIDKLESKSKVNKLTKQLTSTLKNDLKTSSPVDQEKYRQAALKFAELKPNNQKQIISKLSGYKKIEDLIEKIENLVNSIEQGETYEIIKDKINDMDGAVLTYANDKDEILIAHVLKFEASKKLGCTTNWCIARDHGYWNRYKKAGQKYFYIWDFNYPVEDSQYLIGTAYNQKEPESSQTHLKQNQNANLGKIFKEKDLSFDILDDYLKVYRDQFLKNVKIDNFYGKLSFINQTRNPDNEEVISIIEEIEQNVKTSEAIQEHGDPDDVEVDAYRIDIGNNNIWFDILNIDDLNYNTIKEIANNYYIFSDSEEGNYMGSYLNEENFAKIKQIAKLVTYKGAIDRENENISTFLDEYDFNNIIETYVEELNNAKMSAAENTAKAQLAQIPFDLDKSYIYISDIIDFGVKTQTIYESFDDFINNIKDVELNIDEIYEAEYNDLDLDDLNFFIGNELDKILDDLKDPDSDLYQKYHDMNESVKLLEKLGFEEKSGKWEYKDNEKQILINQIFPPDEDAFSGDNDDYDIHMTNIDPEQRLPYSTFSITIIPNDPNKKQRTGLIKAENLYKYVTQYEIPYQESYKNIKKMIKEIVKEKI